MTKIETSLDDDIRAQTMVVLTSGKGLEHALIIRRNKNAKINQVEPVGDAIAEETDAKAESDQPKSDQGESATTAAETK